MAASLPSFGWGGTGRVSTDDSVMAGLFDQSLPFLDTLGISAATGVDKSLGLGTALREARLPEAAPTQQGDVLDVPGSETPMVLETPDYASDRFGGAGVNVADAYLTSRGETEQELATRREAAGALSEEKYKASPYFRPDIPWAPTMTEDRAKVQSSIRDNQKARDFFMEKRPITSFFGQLAGGAVDPTNYIPVAGPAVRAAAIARAGRTLGTAAVMAGEAAVSQGVIGAVTAPERQQFGDDVSWQAQVTDIAMGALTGGLIGGVAGRVGGILEGRAGSLKNQMKARAVLDDAVSTLARDGEVSLTPTSAGFVDDVAQERASLAQAYDSVRSEPSGPAREPLVAITPAEIEGTIVARGAFKDVNDVEFSKRGWGLVKIIWRHGEKGEKSPDLQIRKEDIVDLPNVIREYEPSNVSADGARREWRVQREDGKTVVYADSLMGEQGRHVVTAYIDEPKPEAPPLSEKRAAPLSESSAPAGDRAQDTSADLSIGDRAVGQEAQASTRVRPAPTDIASPAAQIDPARIQQAARAEAAIAKPETLGAIAKDVGFDPVTGESIASPLVRQIEAEGRLTAEDAAAIKLADDGIQDADAWSEALGVATGCVL